MVTQLEKKESQIEKGFWKIFVDDEIKTEFVPLKNNRKFYYEDIFIQNKNNSSLREMIESKIMSFLNQPQNKKPIIKLRIVGKESEVIDADLQELEKKYSDRAIIIFSKELETPEISKKIEFLQNIREQKLSIEEVGLNVLRKNLEDLQFASVFDYEQAFHLLSEGGIDVMLNILTGEQRTLIKW
jgi:hypothetical protein